MSCKSSFRTVLTSNSEQLILVISHLIDFINQREECVRDVSILAGRCKDSKRHLTL